MEGTEGASSFAECRESEGGCWAWSAAAHRAGPEAETRGEMAAPHPTLPAWEAAPAPGCLKGLAALPTPGFQETLPCPPNLNSLEQTAFRPDWPRAESCVVLPLGPVLLEGPVWAKPFRADPGLLPPPLPGMSPSVSPLFGT